MQSEGKLVSFTVVVAVVAGILLFIVGLQLFSEPVDTTQAIVSQQLDLCASPLTPSAINLSVLRGGAVALIITCL